MLSSYPGSTSGLDQRLAPLMPFDWQPPAGDALSQRLPFSYDFKCPPVPPLCHDLLDRAPEDIPLARALAVGAGDMVTVDARQMPWNQYVYDPVTQIGTSETDYHLSGTQCESNDTAPKSSVQTWSSFYGFLTWLDSGVRVESYDDWTVWICD